MDRDKKHERLKELLERRRKYFTLTLYEKKKYIKAFEKVQKEIMALKLDLKLYYDDLDLFVIRFDYTTAEAKERYKILEKAVENREIRWLRREYSPADRIAEYVGQVIGNITDTWLKEKYYEHSLKREGLIDCPWPTILEEDLQNGKNARNNK